MKLYHWTKAADAILAEGFKDATGYYQISQPFTGVWFSNRPLDAADGVNIDFDQYKLLVIELQESAVIEWEWVEEGMEDEEERLRKFLIPATLANSAGKPVVVEDEGEY